MTKPSTKSCSDVAAPTGQRGGDSVATARVVLDAISQRTVAERLNGKAIAKAVEADMRLLRRMATTPRDT
jgi:hypothetical protein